MIFNYFENEKRLLFYEHGVDEIPDEVIAEFRHKDILYIDFSSNALSSLNCLSHFLNVREIILDNNFLSDQSLFPALVFHNAHVLSLNNNKLENLNQLVQNVCQFFPNIRFLSLLGNPLCPLLSAKCNEEDYRNYRLFIISRMPKLKFLDAKMIEPSEWSIIHAETSSFSEQNPTQSVEVNTKNRKSWWRRIFGGGVGGRRDDEDTTNASNAYTPLPSDVTENSQQPPSRTSYGKVRHYYKGTESQGNRFIGNTML